MLGDSGGAPCAEHTSGPNPKAREHVDQGVDAEQIKAPPHEVAHARFRHRKELRRCGLRQPPRPEGFLELDQQIRANTQVFSLVGREPEITEYIACGARHLQGHGHLTCLSVGVASGVRGTAAATYGRGTVFPLVPFGWGLRQRPVPALIMTTLLVMISSDGEGAAHEGAAPLSSA